MDTMLPLTADDLLSIPLARATRLSYNWGDYGRYSVWIAEVSHFGWSVVTDYGKAGVEAVVTAPRTRDNCIAALADYVRDYGPAEQGHDLMIEEWDVIGKRLDAWISHIQDSGSKWAPFPG